MENIFIYNEKITVYIHNIKCINFTNSLCKFFYSLNYNKATQCIIKESEVLTDMLNNY